jgi:hypothetical protein
MRPPTLTAAILLLACPTLAHACAVCNMLGNERNRLAFFSTTVFLSLVPLGLIAWGAIWLFRRGGAAMRDEFMDRDELSAEEGGVVPSASESPSEHMDALPDRQA